MPGRYVREGILTSERVNQLDWEAEVFYRRLMNAVDDYGRFTATPAVLRAALYPLKLDQMREINVSRCLSKCEAAGLVRLYSVGAKQYLQLLDFGQAIRSASKCPPPPGEEDPPISRPRKGPSVSKRMQVHTSAIDNEVGNENENEVEEGGAARAPALDPPPREGHPARPPHAYSAFSALAPRTGIPFPPKFKLDDELRAYALAQGCDPDERLNYLRDTALASGASKVDWRSAYKAACSGAPAFVRNQGDRRRPPADPPAEPKTSKGAPANDLKNALRGKVKP